MSLKDDLEEINGIGPKKAEKIMAAVEANRKESEGADYTLIEEAYDYLTDNKTREARRRLDEFLD